MSGYRSYHSGSDEEAIFDVMKLVLVFAVVVAVVAAVIVSSLLTEVVKVYKTRALAATTTRPVLWAALGLFAGLLGLAALLGASTTTASLGVYIAAWSFLGYSLVVVGCELYERRHDRPQIAATLDEVLLPWPTTTPAVTPGSPAATIPTGQGGHHGSTPVSP